MDIHICKKNIFLTPSVHCQVTLNNGLTSSPLGFHLTEDCVNIQPQLVLAHSIASQGLSGMTALLYVTPQEYHQPKHSYWWLRSPFHGVKVKQSSSAVRHSDSWQRSAWQNQQLDFFHFSERKNWHSGSFEQPSYLMWAVKSARHTSCTLEGGTGVNWGM